MAKARVDFVARDHELESAHERATEALAEHRWHWTKDESNPDRVAFKEYARRVGRNDRTIRKMVHGFAAWKARTSTSSPGGPVTLAEFIEHAALGAETAEATEAVAAVTGTTFKNVAVHNRAEVRDVVATARDRAERKGTTVSDEIPAVAEWREKSRQARQKEAEAKHESKYVLVELEGHIGAAVRRLREGLLLAKEIDFDDEQIEMIADTLAKLRAIVALIDLKITGESGVNWDDEFARVMG